MHQSYLGLVFLKHRHVSVAIDVLTFWGELALIGKTPIYMYVPYIYLVLYQGEHT